VDENGTSPKRAQAAIIAAPPSSFVPPNVRDAVPLFLKHIEKTGDPHSFPGVVSTKPPDGAEFRWLTPEIEVLVAKRSDGAMIPCPWCSKGEPKFKKGRLCWFPVEGVMRFIGWACAKSHVDKDLMREANLAWREENRKKTRDALLRANCRHVRQFLLHAESLQMMAVACDTFHRDFAKDSSGIHADLAQYVRKGEMTVYETPQGQVLNHHERSFSRRFGILNGAAVLKANPHLKEKLQRVVIRLGAIAQDAQRAAGGELNHMDDARRDALEITLRDSHKVLASVISTILAFQAFLQNSNIELLNAWCQHPGADVSASGIEVRRADARLDFAYRVNGIRCTTRVRFNPDMLAPVKQGAALEDGIEDER
jgi:hypothetical protein